MKQFARTAPNTAKSLNSSRHFPRSFSTPREVGREGSDLASTAVSSASYPAHRALLNYFFRRTLAADAIGRREYTNASDDSVVLPAFRRSMPF